MGPTQSPHVSNDKIVVGYLVTIALYVYASLLCVGPPRVEYIIVDRQNRDMIVD